VTESKDIDALAKGGRTNIAGFVLRLAARIPFLFIAGRLYGPDLVGRFALAVVVVELAALVATLGLKRGLAQALSSSDQPHVFVVWDALALAFILSIAASTVLIAFPQVMYANTQVTGLDRFLPCIIVAVAWSDVSLSALAYRHNVKAAVTARAVVEPWTISIAAWVFSFFTIKDGLVLSYVASMTAALIASFVPFLRSYGLPRGWSPHPGQLFALARANAPLAGADALEWGSRNVDRFILGVMFEPKIVGTASAEACRNRARRERPAPRPPAPGRRVQAYSGGDGARPLPASRRRSARSPCARYRRSAAGFPAASVRRTG